MTVLTRRWDQPTKAPATRSDEQIIWSPPKNDHDRWGSPASGQRDQLCSLHVMTTNANPTNNTHKITATPTATDNFSTVPPVLGSYSECGDMARASVTTAPAW